MDGWRCLDPPSLQALLADVEPFGQQPVAFARPACSQRLERLAFVERVRRDAHPLPLLAIALVELLHAGGLVDERDALPGFVELVFLAALDPRPPVGVKLPVGYEDVRVRVVATPVLVYRVRGGIAARVQLAADEPFHHLTPLLGRELSGQGNHDFLRRASVGGTLHRLNPVEQRLGIPQPLVGTLGQQRMRLDDPLTARKPVVRHAEPLIPDPLGGDVRQGRAGGRAGGTRHVAHMQRVDSHQPHPFGKRFSRVRPALVNPSGDAHGSDPRWSPPEGRELKGRTLGTHGSAHARRTTHGCL